ncbi:hypothetical protein KUL67_06915, partial [Bacillus spizizenii]
QENNIQQSAGPATMPVSIFQTLISCKILLPLFLSTVIILKILDPFLKAFTKHFLNLLIFLLF